MNVVDLKFRNSNRVLNHIDILRNRIENGEFGVALVEFHPTDSCNLNCLYCTYRRTKTGGVIFPFSEIVKIAELKPRAILLAGGGEPTLYNDDGHDFADLVESIHKKCDGAKIGLITNGVFIPQGDWKNKIDWVRISIDFLDNKKFKEMKNGGMEKPIANVLGYLKSPIESVGIGFLVNKYNITDTFDFIKFIYTHVKSHLGEKCLDKLNIQIRSCCKIESCNCPSENYQNKEVMTNDESEEWRSEVRTQIEKAAYLVDDGLERFIKERTNLFTFDSRKVLEDFSRCYLSMIRVIIRANGDIYPCVMKASNSKDRIGNIITDGKENIRNSQLQFFELNSCVGHSQCCKVDGLKNNIIERGLASIISEQESNPDPFF